MTLVVFFDPAFDNNDTTTMIVWFVIVIVSFAFIFAVNSSIHSFLVVNYASKDKVAVSVGFYYMSNAIGRLFGTLGSGVLYTFIGEDVGDVAGTNAVAGLAACFFAGTLCSLLSAIITGFIDDQNNGLKCGSCWTIVEAKSAADTSIETETVKEPGLVSKTNPAEIETSGVEGSAADASDNEMSC